MYKPDPPFDTVIVQAHDDVTGELEWTVGSARDAKDDKVGVDATNHSSPEHSSETNCSEHFVVKTEMPWIDESEVTVHYEDIYAYSPEKMESLRATA